MVLSNKNLKTSLGKHDNVLRKATELPHQTAYLQFGGLWSPHICSPLLTVFHGKHGTSHNICFHHIQLTHSS